MLCECVFDYVFEYCRCEWVVRLIGDVFKGVFVCVVMCVGCYSIRGGFVLYGFGL